MGAIETVFDPCASNGTTGRYFGKIGLFFALTEVQGAIWAKIPVTASNLPK
jgi:hypothetical protein